MLKAKKIVILCTLYSVLCTPLLAHTSQIGLGVRGGGQMFMPSGGGELKSSMGGVGGVDLRYTFYGTVDDQIGVGFAVGAGVGYGTTTLKGTHTDQYTNIDYLNNRIDYTNEAKYHIADKFAQANASLLFAFRYSGFTINLGPRLMLPFSSSSSFTIDKAHISAYYPQYDVSVVDKPITGVLETPYTNHKSQITNHKYSVLFGAELGYEWSLTDKFCVGVQLYADVAVWDKKPSAISHQPSALIEVAPITDSANPKPSVTVNPTGIQINSMRYLDFGVRAYIALSVAQDRGYRHHFNSRRDTRKHRNRYLWW